MVARIYRPSKTAMQSGRAGTNKWVLDFEPQSARTIDPLMGYSSSADTKAQIRLKFDTMEEAIAYAKRNNIPHRVSNANERKVKGVSYSDNFKFDRGSPWTH